MIGAALLAGLALSIPGLVMKAYNNSNLWCWISPNWDVCDQQGLTRDECVDQTITYRWIFYYGPLWLTIGLITAAQFCLWRTVRQLEVRSSKWRSTESRAVRMRQTRLVATQATWYILVFLITWLPYTIIDLTGIYFTPNNTAGFAVLLIVVICQPIQGSLNVFVYHRQTLTRASSQTVAYLGSTLSFGGNNSSRNMSETFSWAGFQLREEMEGQKQQGSLEEHMETPSEALRAAAEEVEAEAQTVSTSSPEPLSMSTPKPPEVDSGGGSGDGDDDDNAEQAVDLDSIYGL